MSRFLSPSMFSVLLRVLNFVVEEDRDELSLELFLCALYLQYGSSFASHFTSTFPLERLLVDLGRKPKKAADRKKGHRKQSRRAIWRGRLDEVLFRLLWRAIRMSAAQGKKASLEHFIAALALDDAAVSMLAGEKHLLLRGYLGELRPFLWPVIYQEWFFVKGGEANPERARISLPEDSQGPFFLSVMNGVAATIPTVRHGRIRVNGKFVVRGEALSKSTARVVVQVMLKKRNKLDVWLEGREGSGVRVRLEDRASLAESWA